VVVVLCRQEWWVGGWALASRVASWSQATAAVHKVMAMTIGSTRKNKFMHTLSIDCTDIFTTDA
jgi:hypothetical protein